ncbi:tail fiber domain-containing protein [Paraburkholderia tropica]|uniref:tail fiber domain-containing protein n=1 Tax=Paraburkholderia tropica TaxID=92647 RepID=UPI002AB75917|nr:tail fiber domain-containing protein [Paraburkholderia tropica]
MGALQKVNLGTPPGADDGDTNRVANTKANINVDILNTQATLTSLSPNAVRDLTAADMGKRINFTPTAADTVHFPAASATGADQILAVHNLSTAYDITMAIATGSGDTAPTIFLVKPGEMLTWETDGVSQWRTIGRKKAFDEVVQGKLTVLGAATAASVASTGALSGGSLSIGAVASISAAGAFSGASGVYTGNVSAGTLSVTGLATLTGGLSVGSAAQASITAAGALSCVSGAFSGACAAASLQSTSGTITAGALAATGTGAMQLLYDGTMRTTTNGTNNWGAWGAIWNKVNLPRNSFVGTNSSNTLSIWWDSANTGCRFQIDSTLNSLVLGVSNTFHMAWNNSAVGLYVDSTSLGNITTSSDYRAKKNVKALKVDAVTVVKALRPVTFEWADFELFKADGVEHVGFIAHELQALIPSAVNGEKDAVDEKGTAQIQSLNWAPIVAVLTSALQQAFSRIEALEAR